MELRAPRQCPGREHGGTKETLGGIHDRCEEQPWSFRALQLPWVHPVPSPTQRTMIPTEMLSTRLGQSTFHTKRWQCVCRASLQGMVSISSSPYSPAQGGAKGCLGLGHVYVGEERGPGLCGCCAVCQVAQDAFEFTA